MTSHTANLIGLLVNALGTLFVLFDNIRMQKRVSEDGILLEDTPETSRWYLRYGATIGFSMLFVGFVFQLFGLLCE
jgi:hypothetical protein